MDRLVLTLLLWAPSLFAIDLDRCREFTELYRPIRTVTPLAHLSRERGQPNAHEVSVAGQSQVVFQTSGAKYQALPEDSQEAADLLRRMGVVAKVLHGRKTSAKRQREIDERLGYDDRQALMRDAGLQTVEAYTKGGLPKEETALKAYLRNGENWVPERQAVISSLRTQYSDAVSKVSEHLKGVNPRKTLVLMRGNSGSGKSYSLKHGNHPLMEAAGLSSIPKELEDGIINPDSIKYRLQNEFENGKASTEQVHEEGSLIADLIIDGAFERGDSFIVDKRFGRQSQVEKLTRKAKELGYHVIMIDVDAPLNTSAKRVSERLPGGASPNVSFAPVEQGFVEARSERKAISSLPSIDDYLLFSSDKAHSGLIASRSNGHAIEVAHPAWDRLTAKPSDAELEAAKLRRGDVLDSLSHYPAEAGNALREGTAPAFVLKPEFAEPKRPIEQERPHFFVTAEDLDYWKNSAETSEPSGYDPMTGLSFEMRLPWHLRRDKYTVQAVKDYTVTLTNARTGKTETLPSAKFEKLKKKVIVDAAYIDWTKETIAEVAISFMRTLRYRVGYDYGTLEEHRSYDGLLRYYFTHTLPGVDIRSFETDQTDRSGASVRMELRNVSAAARNRLLHDRYYPFELHVDPSGEEVLVMETKRIDQTPLRGFTDMDESTYWDERRHETDDNGPGYNDPDYESPGSRGREFINFAYRVDVAKELNGENGKRNYPGAPMAFEFRPRRGGFQFERVADELQYRRGFWAHEASAVQYGARLDLNQAKKYFDSSLISKSPDEREKAKDYLLSAKKNINTAQTLAGFSRVVIQEAQKAPTRLDQLYNGMLQLDVPQDQLRVRHRGRSSREALQYELDLAEKWYHGIWDENVALEKEIDRLLEIIDAPQRLRKLEK